MPRGGIWNKIALVLLILIALWMLTDEDFSVWKALARHEPSARIFRSLLQVDLILFGTAFSLYIWSKTAGVTLIRQLLFQPSLLEYKFLEQPRVDSYKDDTIDFLYDNHDNDDPESHTRPQIELVQSKDSSPDDHEYDDDEDPVTRARHQMETLDSFDKNHADADYDSEGEIPIPDHDETSSHDTVPSAVSVLSAALDMLLVILVTLFFFGWSASGWHASDDSWQVLSRIAAPIFPLILFLYLAVTLLPWQRKRREFWVVLLYTLAAPWPTVTFRDGFVGDVLTSSVRPLQDITFTVVYILYGLQGWWSASYFVEQPESNNTTLLSQSFVDSADASVPVMEKSWLLHTILLPLCMVSPLWWRFLQNLRQTYDYRQRWPYLGNALKYAVAAAVAVSGVFYPDCKHSPVWLTSFVLATLYQIWWDVVMDWGLLEKTSGRWQLRKRRLYTKTAVYWMIALVNVALRFCWTLSFVPPRYLNAAGVLTENFSAILHPFISCAEIIRRTLWGLLRFEYEVMKVGGGTANDQMRNASLEQQDVELVPMKVMDEQEDHRIIPFTNDMSSMNDIQVLAELCTYATLFATMCLVAAAHRGTL